MNILLLEDNEAIIMGLEYLLVQEGYHVSTARSIQEGKRWIQEKEFDLALLDIMLPDGDGFAFCKLVKDMEHTAVIFLTAKEEEGDVVKGLDLGADDYIVKPFRNRELLSRIKSVLRRAGKVSSRLHYGDIVLDLDTRKVTRAGREIVLTRLEYKIFSSMMAYPGKLFTREEILSGIWDISGNFVNDNTLSVTMKRIREKLGDPEGQVIRTVRGMGYRIEKIGKEIQL